MGLITVNYIALDYIKYLKRNGTTSEYSIESVYRNHISQSLGNKEIKSIGIRDIRDLQSEMLEKTYNNNKKYSNKSINMVTGTFNMIMNFAVKYEYIKINPCSNFPCLRKNNTHDKLKFWTDEEFTSAIKFEYNFMWYCYLVISYLTGMRKGEIRALRWSDINFKKNIITINQHINDKLTLEQRSNREQERIISGRKNGGSHILMMDDNTHNLLLALKEIATSLKTGGGCQRYVFGGENPVGQNSPKRHLDKIAEKAGLDPIAVHGLRHSHASYLISQGLNAYEVAERLGDQVEMVLKVYGHMFPNPQKKVVSTLNNNFDFFQRKE